MNERIRTWFYLNTSPEMREDMKLMYKLDEDFFMSFVERAGVEHILNRNLDFRMQYHGSTLGSDGKKCHHMSVSIEQDKMTIHSEQYSVCDGQRYQ